MRTLALNLCLLCLAVALAWVATAQTAPPEAAAPAAPPEASARTPAEEPAKNATPAGTRSHLQQLLDRGAAARSTVPTKGGSPPPAGPTPIFLAGPPPGSPGAVPAPPGAGALGVSVFGTGTAAGGLLGNLHLPGIDYPPSFLTAGGVSGFDVTGAYAWHLAPTTMASFFRIVGAASVPPPATPMAPAGPIATGISAATPIPGPGFPAASGLISLIGAWPPVRVTAGASAIFCGLLVGGPGYTPATGFPAWGGNGLGGIVPGAQPPLRAVPFPLGAATSLPTILAPPAKYIVGCYADSSTTPVELMAFSVD